MSENYDDREKWGENQLLTRQIDIYRGIITGNNTPEAWNKYYEVKDAIRKRMRASELLEKKLAIAMMAFDTIIINIKYWFVEYGQIIEFIKRIKEQIAALDTPTAPESSNSDEDEWEDVELKDGYVKENDVIHWKPDGKLIVKHGDDHIAYDIASLLTPPTDIAKITRRVPKKKVDELTAEYSTGKVAELQKAMLDAMDIMTGALGIKHHPQDEYDKMADTLKRIARVYLDRRGRLDTITNIGVILRESGYVE